MSARALFLHSIGFPLQSFASLCDFLVFFIIFLSLSSLGFIITMLGIQPRDAIFFFR